MKRFLLHLLPLLIVAFMAPAAFGQGALAKTLGAAQLDHTGAQVEWIDDLTQDGIDEYLVCTPDSDANGIDSGRVELRNGKTHEVIREYFGASAGDRFGYAATSVGDINLDGKGDFAISSPWSGSGLVQIYSGQTGLEISSLVATNYSPQTFGTDLDGGLDVNNDGWPDLIIADYWGEAAHLVSGFDWSVLAIDYSGNTVSSVSLVSDLDGDGFHDFAIGQEGTIYVDRVEVFSGQTMSPLYLVEDSSTYVFGNDISFTPDLDGDSIPDLIVGANLDDVAGANAGRVYVYSGASGQLIYELAGTLQDRFGTSVGGGDVNQDGFGDIIVGVPQEDPSGLVNAGAVHVYSGQDGSLLSVTYGEKPGDQFGSSVSRRQSDCNLDGYLDTLVGAPEADPQGSNSGGAYVIAAYTDLRQSPLSPGIAGQVNTLTVSGAAAGTSVYLLYGLQYGSAQMPGCPTFLSLGAPTMVGSQLADGTGNATFSGTVPAGLSGTTLLFQVASPSNCAVTGVNAQTF